jgi:hypothetical protein
MRPGGGQEMLGVGDDEMLYCRIDFDMDDDRESHQDRSIFEYCLSV